MRQHYMHFSTYSVFILFTVLLGCSSGANEQETSKISTPTDSEVDDFVSTQMEQRNIPALSFAVLDGAKVLHHRHYGTTNLDVEQTPSDSTAYQLASASKLITGTLVMMLAEEGKLNIKAPIGDYLPDLPEAWSSIPVKRLLSHTSGLSNIMDAQTGRFISYSPQASYDAAVKRGLQTSPGATWSYNQLGFMLVQRALARISGSSFQDLVEDRLLKPLNMEHSSFDSAAIAATQARVYSLNEGQADDFPTSMQELFPEALHAAGGMYTSTADLIGFHQALIGGELISAETRKKLWQPIALNNGKRVNYGLGWEIERSRDQLAVGHSGGQKAVYSYLQRDGVAVIILTNAFGARPQDMTEKLLDLYL